MKKLILTLLTVCSGFLAAHAQNNVITGMIQWDSTANGSNTTSFMVYLIMHDTAANTLTAIDSQQVSGWLSSYSFLNAAPGSYLTKAAPQLGTSGANLLMPTYHDSSLYWNSATTINHGSGITYAPINMKTGVNTSGVGFIGGNISAGANKGTGGGIPGIMVALLNSGNQTLSYDYTDINGDYSFSNLPVGTYTVFPEALNYITIEATNVAVTAAQPLVTTLDFKQTPTHIKLIPSAINDLPTANLFSVYPNPADGSVKINYTSDVTGKVNISVVDVTGRQVIVRESNAKSNDQIDLSKLTSGTYFINITTEKATHSEQIVVKH